MQAKIVLVVETPNDDFMRTLQLFVTKQGVTYGVGDKALEVHEFHAGMNPLAINPSKITRSTSDKPGDEAPDKDSMETQQ